MRFKIVWALLALLMAVPASAQVSSDGVAEIAKAIHDAEHVDLGAASTRDSRNAFWARVMGVVHFGHPVYNPTPDSSWCIKDGGNGRPQSDDVAVKCVSREFWDCIGGAGAPGYTFRCNKDAGPLPNEQNVYAPPRPAEGGASSGGGGNPPSTPPSTDLGPVLQAIAALKADLATLTVKVDAVAGVAVDARDAALSAAHDAREVNAWRMEPKPVPVLAVPCLVGRVPKPFGGSSEVTFCPKPE